MDVVTIFGFVVGLVGIVGGMLLEGGHLGSILQLTAAIIVFGGTVGAVMVGTTREDLIAGLRLFRLGFSDSGGEKDTNEDPELIARELIEAAQLARKESILALERRLPSFSNPFMRDVFRFVIDGVDPQVLRDVFESRILLEEENALAGAKIYVDAGGFAPTVGIIGAVLGLIHVMSNLTDTSKLGAGIAVAFVATVYGVGSANLFFLPLGNKIKRKIRKRAETRIMIIEGAISIMNGLSPVIVEEKIRPYLHSSHSESKKANIAEAA